MTYGEYMDKEFLDLKEINSKSYKQFFNENDRRNKEIDTLCGLNKYSHSDCIERSEFSRDKDRILFSKAFRRLEHKAQIYSHEKGDHYRTRLTHTLEVLQIARNISRYLGLDEDLTEAIVLGYPSPRANFVSA
jgi:dGTPase